MLRKTVMTTATPSAIVASSQRIIDFRVGNNGPDRPEAIDPKRAADLLSFARQVLPASIGKITDDSALTIKVLAGGTSNQLYHVFSKDIDAAGTATAASLASTSPSTPLTGLESPLEVVVRVFGEGLSDVVDREAEFFWQEKFLATYGRCHNALAYEFLRGFCPIGVDGVRASVGEVCGALAALHSKSNHAELPESLIMAKKGDEGQKLFCRTMLEDWVDRATSAAVVDKLEKKYSSSTSSDEVMAANASKLAFVRSLIETGGSGTDEESGNSVCQLRQISREILAFIDSPKLRAIQVVTRCCHNDLNVLNIMVPSAQLQAGKHPLHPVKLIDYEYAGPNFFQWDLGNHLNEWAGLECEYDKLFPTEEQQLEVMHKYLKALQTEEKNTSSKKDGSDTDACALCPNSDSANDQHPRCFCALLKNYERDPKGTAELLRVSSLLHALVSHMGWVSWSLFQQAGSQIEDFDYLDYARMRFNEYQRQRKAFDAMIAKL